MLSLQQLVGAAERLRATRERLDEEDLLAAIEHARSRLAARPFEGDPLSAFRSIEGDKERVLASPSLSDRVLEEAIRPLFEAALEPLLSDAVHSWRPGRSTWTAARAFQAALARGEAHVLGCDVASYFESIDRDLLRAALETLLPAHADVVHALASADLRLDGKRVVTERGIPLGRPLSPLLANAYLLPVDAALGTLPVTYLRYGDDLLIAVPSAHALAEAEERLRDALAELGLGLRAEKTRRHRYDGAPIEHLGHLVDADGVWERVAPDRLDRIAERGARRSAEAELARARDASPSPIQAAPRTHTVYVTEPGLYLTVKQGLLLARRGHDTTLEIALHRVDRILVMAGVSLSSALVSACLVERVTIVFFVGKGRAFGSLVGGGMPNPLRLRSQYDLVSRPARRAAIARDVVLAKLAAMKRRLLNVPDADAIRAELAGVEESLPASADPVALRGFEGAATRAYYRGFALRIREPDFAFHTRSRQPPKDPINSLLSFAYSLLFFEMQTALLAHGLDPHPALLHDLHRNHPALASDLIEPYRALVADTFVLTLVNDRQVTASGFETQGGGAVYMRDATRRSVLDAWERFVMRPLGGARGTVSPRGLIDAAALAMLSVVLGERERLELPLVGSLIDNPHPRGTERLDASGPAPVPPPAVPGAATAAPAELEPHAPGTSPDPGTGEGER